eukprot:scaffold4442_cov125-Amphora_coffeaeformis.AAC.36
MVSSLADTCHTCHTCAGSWILSLFHPGQSSRNQDARQRSVSVHQRCLLAGHTLDSDGSLR